MIFRQLLDPQSSSYTYLIASRRGGEALLIDPVLDLVPHYLGLLRHLDLKLTRAVDTHLHADHVTGLGKLRQITGCLTAMAEQTLCKLVDLRLRDGELIKVDDLVLRAVHTPGHTADSLCLVMQDRVFTGDTLLIGGTGRTDFQGGDAAAQYDALFGRLLTMPDETLVYPGHDYKGRWVSSIGEERSSNPRLQAGSREAYMAIMAELDLPRPKLFDLAVPANLRLGLPDTRAYGIAPGRKRRSAEVISLAPFSGL